MEKATRKVKSGTKEQKARRVGEANGMKGKANGMKEQANEKEKSKETLRKSDKRFGANEKEGATFGRLQFYSYLCSRK